MPVQSLIYDKMTNNLFKYHLLLLTVIRGFESFTELVVIKTEIGKVRERDTEREKHRERERGGERAIVKERVHVSWKD